MTTQSHQLPIGSASRACMYVSESLSKKGETERWSWRGWSGRERCAGGRVGTGAVARVAFAFELDDELAGAVAGSTNHGRSSLLRLTDEENFLAMTTCRETGLERTRARVRQAHCCKGRLAELSMIEVNRMR